MKRRETSHLHTMFLLLGSLEVMECDCVRRAHRCALFPRETSAVNLKHREILVSSGLDGPRKNSPLQREVLYNNDREIHLVVYS